MSIVITKPALGAALLASSCIGAGIGYLAAVKKLSAEFDNRLEEETAKMRTFYTHTPQQKYNTPQEAVADLVVPEVVGEKLTEYQGGQKTAYHKIVPSKADTEVVDADGTIRLKEAKVHEITAVEENIFEKQATVDPDKPHIISQEEFLENEPGHEQISLTYYEADAKLTDEQDDLIDEVEKTTGLDFIVNFGYKSSDERVVHVRNMALALDFEISKSDGSYSREVLGVDEEPMQSARQRIRGV
jgi:hypothetical protein